LRRQGFTLRMIAAAERDGLVHLDLSAGRVAVRPRAGGAHDPGGSLAPRAAAGS